MPLARVMQLAQLAINQTSRSGAALGSMSEIGNVPIFSGSESRFREGPACARTTLAMIGVINAIIYGRLRALRRVFEPPRVPRCGEKTLPIGGRDRRRPCSLVVRSNFKQIICSSALRVQLGAAVAKAKHGAVCLLDQYFYIL